MEQINKLTTEALNWLRYVLNPNTEMPTVTDWAALFLFADKQKITGICLPDNSCKNIENNLLLQWIGTTHLIEQQNRLLNQRVEQLFNMLEQEGFDCCLLKGQGNAEMYPNPLRRCSGDIDVWVNSDEEKAYQYVLKQFPDAEVSYKHIHFPIFTDAPVDVHVAPLKFNSRFYLKRLREWVEQNRKEQFAHKMRLTGTNREVNVPTGKFNVVYQLGHMLIHLLDEGLGLRQVVDYFYVLKNLDVSEKERKSLEKDIEALGLYRFAKALMWVESHVLGLPIELCIVSPNERMGKRLLNDILEGGNFGHYSERYHGRKGFYYRGCVEALRNIRLLSFAPREGIARLSRKMGTALRHATK